MTNGSEPPAQTGAQAVVADAVSTNAVDPARRPDVLFRVRREEGQQAPVWWPIAGFLVASGAVIALMNFIPGRI